MQKNLEWKGKKGDKLTHSCILEITMAVLLFYSAAKDVGIAYLLGYHWFNFLEHPNLNVA